VFMVIVLVSITSSTQVSEPLCGSKFSKNSGDFFYEQLSIPSLGANEVKKNCSWSFDITPEEEKVLHIRFALIIKLPVIILPDGSNLYLKDGRNDLLRPIDFYYSINPVTSQCKDVIKKMTFRNVSIILSSNKMTRLYGFYEFLCGGNCIRCDGEKYQNKKVKCESCDEKRELIGSKLTIIILCFKLANNKI